MIRTQDIKRPPKKWVEGLRKIGAATASSTLSKLGIRNAHITGPVSWSPGKAVAVPR